jgi:hypothetical protein
VIDLSAYPVIKSGDIRKGDDILKAYEDADLGQVGYVGYVAGADGDKLTGRHGTYYLVGRAKLMDEPGIYLDKGGEPWQRYTSGNLAFIGYHNPIAEYWAAPLDQFAPFTQIWKDER